jgi:pilus assembly protein CpaE
MGASNVNEDQGRPTIAVAMAEPDLTVVLEALADAGFDTIALDPKAKLAEAFSPRHPRLIAIVDVAGDPAGAVERAAEARRGRPDALSVVFCVDEGDLDALGAASMTDTDEILIRPFELDALRWRVEAMAIRAQVGATDGADPVLAGGNFATDLAPAAPVYAVFNPKGGVGKTTIATNLAAVLQLWKNMEVLLLDADTVTGHVGLSLGLTAGRSAADSWADEDQGYGHETLLDLSTKHDSGIRVATLSTNPLSHATLSPTRVADAIMEARQTVDAIVVDLHPSYSEVNLAVFAIADRILVPVTPDLPAMRAAIQLKEVAAEIGVRDRLAMIINRANSGVPVADMEATVGLPAMAQIRSAGLHFVWSANAGKTLIDKFPKHAAAHDFEQLADRLLSPQPGAAWVPDRGRDPGALLRGLFGRKAVAEVQG